MASPRTPGRTRRNQPSLEGVKPAGAAGWLRERRRTATKAGQRASRAEEPFPGAGYGLCPPGAPAALLVPQAAREPSFPEHTHPAADPSPRSGIVSLCQPESPTATPATGCALRGARAGTALAEPADTGFPKKPCPGACRRASGGGPRLPGCGCSSSRSEHPREPVGLEIAACRAPGTRRSGGTLLQRGN